MNKMKICVVTSSRADYGLLYYLLKEIELDNDMHLQLIVTGTHLSNEFGLTYKEIEKSFKIDKKLEIQLISDTALGISKSMGFAQISFSEVYEELRPELLIVLGDRYEIFSAATAAMVSRIPIAHISGGETTEGVIDEAIRHSLTKMSHLHFVSTEEYKNRVIQLGENPNTVFNVGALGIDNIKKLNLLERKKLEKLINFKFNQRNILVTFHPVTLEKSTSKQQFQELLNSIDKLKDTSIIFTKSNSDIDGKVINRMIDEYVLINDNTIAFDSMGQINYLSALKVVDAVVGNSSSGLTEAPSFGIGTINIGDRQKGRINLDSVINCNPLEKSIDIAIKEMYSVKFQRILKSVKNPFGNGNASKKIQNIIKNYDFENILKKSFYNLNQKNVNK
jgi:GDP/UDP-N,N'-diacetylbacillosamine 2-epimerase (hydrolysing)